MREIARGDNFTIANHGGYLQLTVVRRPDLSLAQGAAAGQAMFAVLVELLDSEAHAGITLMMDLRDAPLPGPRTRAAIGEFFEQWLESGRRVGVITSHAAMSMMYRRLLAAWDDQRGCCFDDPSAAERWATGALSVDELPRVSPSSAGFERPRTGAHAAAPFTRHTPPGGHPRPSSTQHTPPSGSPRPTSDPFLRGLSPQVIGSGDNFSLHLEGQVAILIVVRRPDLSLERGAENAREMLALVGQQLERDRAEVDTLIVDLSDAPVPGPNTRATLGDLIASWEQAGRRIAIVVGHPTMRMLFRRLIAANAPEHGEVFDSLRSARLWAAGITQQTIDTATSGSFRIVPRRGSTSFDPDDG